MSDTPRSEKDTLAKAWREFWDNESGPKMDWKTIFVFLVTPVLLTIFYYWGRPHFFRRNLTEWAAGVWGADWEYLDLAAYGYWAGASLVLRVLIPILIVVLIFRERASDYGFKLKGAFGHTWVYVIFMLIMLPLLFWVSHWPSFQSKYPFYDQAHLGGVHFWGYELFYFIQFFSLEAFFRGFLIFALYKRFGYYAVLIMAIPYCMIHFNKPPAETFGAVLAGIALGVLALRSGSFYLGVVLHYGVAIVMDVLALWQTSS